MKLTRIPPEPPPSYTLELSGEELGILRVIMGGIGGINPGREFSNELYTLLINNGIERTPAIDFTGRFV